MNLGPYRKLVAAAVGVLSIILGPGFLGVSPDEQFFGIGQEKVVEMIFGLLTAFGVYMVPNEPMASEPSNVS